MSERLINRIKNMNSVVDIDSMFTPEVVKTLRRRFPEVDSHMDYLERGKLLITTDSPYRKSIKINFKLVDYVIESEDGYRDIYIYIDLLVTKNLSEEDKLFVGRWAQSYSQDDPIQIDINDEYLNTMDVWVRVVKINGEYVDIGIVDLVDPPSDTRFFDLFNIPYEDENSN